MINKKIFKLVIIILLSSISIESFGQNITESEGASSDPSVNINNGNTETRTIFKRKGNLYFYWGYPKAYFTQSDIHFHDDYYDFTITNNKTFITFGQDHMKYSMDKQVTFITGHIDQGKFKGTYNNTMIVVGEDSKETVTHTNTMDSLPGEFVAEFEHCDGLNDFGFEIGRLEQFWISKNNKHALSVQGTFGMGMMIPDSEVEVLQLEERHNNGKGRKSFHLAGYSISASIGAQFDFFNHFFILGKLKTGFINLPDIYTSLEGGRASQHFNFIEPMLVLGYSGSINKKK